jgi:hypothetical protein
MEDESAKKNGRKWLMVVLLVSAVFAVLIIAAYVNNSAKRDSIDATFAPPDNRRG